MPEAGVTPRKPLPAKAIRIIGGIGVDQARSFYGRIAAVLANPAYPHDLQALLDAAATPAERQRLTDFCAALRPGQVADPQLRARIADLLVEGGRPAGAAAWRDARPGSAEIIDFAAARARRIATKLG